MIKLAKIDENNIWKVIKLKVAKEQKEFVATNTQSLLEAYLAVANGFAALPFAICNGEKPVGFIMFGFGSSGDAGEPSVAKDNYCIWRLMIDKAHQGKGYGSAAFELALSYLRSYPLGKAEYCWISYEPENTVAKKLYASFGFTENGETDGEEIVAVLKL